MGVGWRSEGRLYWRAACPRVASWKLRLDEGGHSPEGLRPHRKDRLSHAWENSYEKLPRSGLLVGVSKQAVLELYRRQVAKC